MVKVPCFPQEYWDTCADAGPPKRVSAAFEERMPDLKILARDGKQLKLSDCRAASFSLHQYAN